MCLQAINEFANDIAWRDSHRNETQFVIEFLELWKVLQNGASISEGFEALLELSGREKSVTVLEKDTTEHSGSRF